MTLEQLLKIYSKKYSKDIVSNIDNVQEYNSYEPQETKKLLSLYKIRNEIYKEKNGVDNSKFKTLIEDLEMYKEPDVIMHILNVNGHYHMILTNVNFTEVITEL